MKLILTIFILLTFNLSAKVKYKIDNTCKILLTRAVYNLNKSRTVKTDASQTKYSVRSLANLKAFDMCRDVAETFGLKETRVIMEGIK